MWIDKRSASIGKWNEEKSSSKCRREEEEEEKVRSSNAAIDGRRVWKRELTESFHKTNKHKIKKNQRRRSIFA